MDVLGIEIREDGTWAFVHLKSSLLGMRVEGFGLLNDEMPDGRLEGLKRYTEKCGLKAATRIAVGLPRGAAVSRVLCIPAPEPSAIEGILRFELEKHIPFRPEDSYFGFQILGREKNEFSVLLAAARKDKVDGIMEKLGKAGLRPSFIGVWQASLFNAFHYWKRIPRGGNIAFIGVCNGNISLDIFSNLVPVYTKSIQTAGAGREEWIGALKRELRLSLSSTMGSAEARKLYEGIIISENEPEEIISALSNDIEHIVSVAGLNDMGVPPSTAPAMGIALSALGKGKLNINLAPDKAAGKQSHYLNTVTLASISIFMLASVGASYILRDVIELKRLESAISEAKFKKEGVESVAGTLKTLDERQKTLEDVKGGSSLEVLKELTELLPKDTWLSVFEYSGGAVSIEGHSESASSLILKMERSRLIKEAEFSGPVTKKHNGKEHFRIRFKLKGAE